MAVFRVGLRRTEKEFSRESILISHPHVYERLRELENKSIHTTSKFQERLLSKAPPSINELSIFMDLNFDLYNEEFKSYCHDKGVLYKAGKGRTFALIANTKATWDDFLNRYTLTYPDENGRQMYMFSQGDLILHWNIILNIKNEFQRLWEEWK